MPATTQTASDAHQVNAPHHSPQDGGGRENGGRALAYLFLTLTILAWTGNNVAGRAAAGADIPPIALAFWRWAISLAIILPFAIGGIRRHWRTILAHWRFFLVFGVLSCGLYNTLLYLGLQYTTALQGSLIISALPAVIVLLSAVFLGERATPGKLAGVLLSVGGAALIIVRADYHTLINLDLNVGDLWITGALLCWAIFAIVTRWGPMQIGVVPLQTVANIVGLVFLAPLYVWEMSSGRTMPMTMETAGLVTYAGIIAGVIGFAMWNAAVFRVGAATAGYFANLYPIFGALLAVLLLGETLYWYHFAGGLLVLAGIALVTLTNRPAAPPKGPA